MYADRLVRREIAVRHFLVLVFFRGHFDPLGAPFLGKVEAVADEVRGKGGAIYGVTAQSQARATYCQKEWKLSFPVLSDPRCILGRRFSVYVGYNDDNPGGLMNQPGIVVLKKLNVVQVGKSLVKSPPRVVQTEAFLSDLPDEVIAAVAQVEAEERQREAEAAAKRAAEEKTKGKEEPGSESPTTRRAKEVLARVAEDMVGEEAAAAAPTGKEKKERKGKKDGSGSSVKGKAKKKGRTKAAKAAAASAETDKEGPDAAPATPETRSRDRGGAAPVLPEGVEAKPKPEPPLFRHEEFVADARMAGTTRYCTVDFRSLGIDVVFSWSIDKAADLVNFEDVWHLLVEPKLSWKAPPPNVRDLIRSLGYTKVSLRTLKKDTSISTLRSSFTQLDRQSPPTSQEGSDRPGSRSSFRTLDRLSRRSTR